MRTTNGKGSDQCDGPSNFSNPGFAGQSASLSADEDGGSRQRSYRHMEWALKILVLVACCATDAFVLRSTWASLETAPGQLRRGYFERFGDEVGLAIDDLFGQVFPSFLLTSSGVLEVPPGLSAVAVLEPGVDYEVTYHSKLSPYVLLGAQGPVEPRTPNLKLRPGEARLVGARTLAFEGDHLALVAWDGTRPWREDAAKLSALDAACSEDGSGRGLKVKADQDRLEVRLGRCSLVEPLPASDSTLLAVLAGPDWATMTRRPGWVVEHKVIWPVLAVVTAKVVAFAWAAGLVSTAAVSATLGIASLVVPVQATLTWPLTLFIGIVAAIVRVAVIARRRLPRGWRLPCLVLALALSACVARALIPATRSFPPIVPPHGDHGQQLQCAVIGYSMASGAGLRDSHGGFSSLLDDTCDRCRDKTAGRTAGGEVLSWARDAYCASPHSFGKDGSVIFLGGANDDFLWGVTSTARMFVVGQQGSEPWARNLKTSAAASRARIDAQVDAINGLMQCAQSNGAGFLFLHDFLVGDLVAGRDPDRAAMLARRRAAVEAAGGRFVDLYEVFGAEAGISWFNDYVHLSLIGHERLADLTCRNLR
ncbi:MAG: hypothetical protein HY270_12295 [Deltaproteobacteria bacterium]|nr:hypothetical protein [Deltaproteobacteria bacterium]